MIDIEYWKTEVVSFKKRLPESSPENVRRLLRGLAVLVTEVTKENPDDFIHVVRDFIDCLELAEDRGVSICFDAWLRIHASPQIASEVEGAFSHSP